MMIVQIILGFLLALLFLPIIVSSPILFLIFLLFAGAYYTFKYMVKITKVEEIRKAIRDLNNNELARMIRGEEDEKIKKFLTDEFFARGNEKKDLYNF